MVASDNSPRLPLLRPVSPIESPQKPLQVYCRQLKPPSETSTSPNDPTPNPASLPIALHKGKCSCTYHPISQFVSYGHLSSSLHAFTTSLNSTIVPKFVQKAMSISGWKSTIEAKMSALSNNAIWYLVTRPPRKTTVGCHWVYTVKYLSDGSIECLKARLVSKGYTQIYSVDYTETFSPVAKISSVRILISLAANLGWPLFQLDVKNVFLNGNLKEEVYMEQPFRFVAHGESGKVCRLHKAIYGLKQSPNAWFGKFSEVVLKFELQRCHSDHSMFSHTSDRGKILLIVYVDDI